MKDDEEKDLLTHETGTEPAFMSVNGKDAYITSWDGLELHGLEIRAKEESHKYVIICHGYKSNALNMGGDAIRFREAGYHILAPDARGLGESEGNYIGMGWPERRDVVDWARRIIQEDGQARILLSMAFPWGGNRRDGKMTEEPSDSGQGSSRGRLWLYFRMGRIPGADP
ncbi:MAG: alpha/beta hydrolase [[Clostridium] scindens]